VEDIVGEYVQIGEVKTWYEQEGSGEPLVLLHGGMATNGLWAPQLPDFAARFRVLAPERRGHGHTPDLPGPLSYDVMAADTIGFLETVVDGPAHLVGFSDGGIVALLVAMTRPDLVHKLVALSAHFDTSGIVPEAAVMMASWTPASDEVAMLRSPYESVSPDGPEHWPVVFAKFLEMASTQPTISIEQLGTVNAPTLVLAGDDDMIALEHTAALSRAIPNAQLGLVPGTSHFLAMEKPALVNRLVLDFLEQDPVATFLPFRRAPEAGG
jgi:pimeloyl-ACP methyl ester carboxylesterase